jgi:hypothetical protein
MGKQFWVDSRINFRQLRRARLSSVEPIWTPGVQLPLEDQPKGGEATRMRAKVQP